jgi:adenine-specific DNA methylase
MSEKKRLIEVLMPLEQASILSPDEKYVSSGGYISTFHVWTARRPLAACRAALLATLLPDPGDAAARAELLEAIGGKITLDDEESTDSEGNLVVEQKSRVKGGVLAWNAEDSPFMESLRQKIRDAHGGKAPQVFDPFSGGGAIPYEAMWLGSHSTASDLNPVAWLLLKGTLEYPQKYAGKKWPLPEFVNQWSDFLEDFHTGGKKRKAPSSHFTDAKQATLPTMFDGDLRWQMRAWGRWVLDKARADLAEHYPVVNGEPTVAYLWARTCRDIQTGGRIPVLKTFMVCRKKGVRFALLPVVDEEKKAVTFKLLTEEHLSTPERRARVIEDHPFLASGA